MPPVTTAHLMERDTQKILRELVYQLARAMIFPLDARQEQEKADAQKRVKLLCAIYQTKRKTEK